MDNSRYLKQALAALFEMRGTVDLQKSGSLLMDVPECSSFSELVGLAGQHGMHADWDDMCIALARQVTRAR